MGDITANQLCVVAPGDSERLLLRQINFAIPAGTFAVIVGPSGCGKTTLLKVLAGLMEAAAGSLLIGGADPVELRSQRPTAVAYLPQFAAFHEPLTAREVLRYAMRLRLPSFVAPEEREKWLGKIVELAGLEPLLSQRVDTLSGGQRRRLALAEELVGNPQFLFLDELTSGLDPHAEMEMMQWMAGLVRQTGKTVVLVTHSVGNLHQAGQVLFLNRGQLLYAGPPDALLPAFSAESWQGVYATADSYSPSEEPRDAVLREHFESMALESIPAASALSQFFTILGRQTVLFFRERGQFWLHLLLALSFPVLVALFASSGLPAVKSLSLRIETSVVTDLTEKIHYLTESFHVASLVAGLSMFQVILLTLMGANNGAREIAKERAILLKELRAGLSPFAYLASKLAQAAVLSFVQSAWMTWFVKTMCGFPGSLADQFLILFLATFAMSTICLMFSALSATPERASLLAIYLVGLQLPLSGAVLALPQWLTFITHPLIDAYWGWSGYLRTFETFRHYDVVQQSTKTTIAAYNSCLVMLCFHITVAALVAWIVLQRRKTRPVS